jgi:hypothetical protein
MEIGQTVGKVYVGKICYVFVGVMLWVRRGWMSGAEF